jgi:hypothetical protein
VSAIVAAASANRSIPVPGEVASPEHQRWSRSATRLAVLPAIALAVVGAAFVATQGDGPRQSTSTRRAATPTMKQTTSGGHVRWHADSIDVVVDKSFTELAGPEVFGAALDAWRATGAPLPSVSTKSGKDRQVGYKSEGANENVVVYAPTGWSRANGALAITVLTFEEASGRIVDADVLLNGGGRYFAVFDSDQSSGDPISIDGSGSASSGGTTPSKTAKFDVQSVVTHEVGHFFGLGEDYDEQMATMYVSTRYGEIHKRVVTNGEGSVMATLYAGDVARGSDATEARGGCGGAQLARPGSLSSAWMGFVVAGLGLGLYVAARHSRAETKPVPVRVASRRSARRMRRVGGWLTAIGFAAALTPPIVEAATDEGLARADAEVEIVKAEPHWVDGIVETSLTYRVTTCHVANCPEGDQRTVALGGKLDGVTQIVGPFGMPEVGARVSVRLRDGRGLRKTLSSTFQP